MSEPIDIAALSVTGDLGRLVRPQALDHGRQGVISPASRSATRATPWPH